jgi:hypothetical protein
MKAMTTQPHNNRMWKKPSKDPLPYLPNDKLPYLVRGYPKLAGRMAKRPEQAIFRRFDELNARNLLYMQVELCKLELQIRTKEMQDKQKDLEYSTDYEKLAASHESAYAAQIQLIEKIKKKSEDYSMCPMFALFESRNLVRVARSLCSDDAVIQASIMAQTKAPATSDLYDLQDWLASKAGGSNILRSGDARAWGTAVKRKFTSGDLRCLKPRMKEDWISRFVAENAIKIFGYDLGPWFGCSCRQKTLPTQFGYYASDVYKITFWMTNILGSLIPIVSIAVLMWMDSMRAQVGSIAGFNVLVAMCLCIFTDAKRMDCFKVTAA